MTTGPGRLSRRSFLRTGVAFGAAAGAVGAAGLATPGLAQAGLPDVKSVLDAITVDNYVRADYRKLYSMSGEPLWDPAKDWIRTVDWEKVRSELAGTTVRFAIGAADQESAADGLKPFEQLSGIKVELVPIPDDSASTTRPSRSSSRATPRSTRCSSSRPGSATSRGRGSLRRSTSMPRSGRCRSTISTTPTD